MSGVMTGTFRLFGAAALPNALRMSGPPSWSGT